MEIITRRYYSIPQAATFFEIRLLVDNYPWPVRLDDARAVQIQASECPCTGLLRLSDHADSSA